MNLLGKSLLLILLLFVAIAVAVSLLSARTLNRALTDEYLNRGVAIAQALVDAGTETLVNRDLATVQAAVDQFVDMDGVAYVFISDAAGDIVSHTFVPSVPAPLPGLVHDLKGTGLDGSTRSVTLELAGFGNILHVYAPMLAGAAGHVHVGMDIGFIRGYIQRTILQQQLLFGGIFLLAMLLAVIFTRRISQPLTALAQYTRNLAEHGFADDVAVPATVRRRSASSKDEIGQLANAFMDMGQNLRRHIEDLRDTTAAKERIESELNIAHDIQMSLVPRTFPPFPEQVAFELFASLEPAREVGGDFYDFFFVGEHLLCIAIADVSDKGVPASLFMALTRTLLRTVGRYPGTSPAAIMAHLNDEISSDNDSCMFVTAFCAFVDIQSGEVTFCNAGHNPPMLLEGDQPRELVSNHGPALGMSENAQYADHQLLLKPGDLLFLFTDGITEAMDNQHEQFGEDNLEKTLAANHDASCSGLLDAVSRDVAQFASGAPVSDDMTMLAFRYLGHDSKRQRVLSLELDTSDEGALGILNDRLETLFREQGWPETLGFRVRLALEELVLNILNHSKGEQRARRVLVRIDTTPTALLLRIRDDGAEFNPESIKDADTTSSLEDRTPGGLGLHLVRKMAQDFQYHRDGGHNVVSFLIPMEAQDKNQ